MGVIPSTQQLNTFVPLRALSGCTNAHRFHPSLSVALGRRPLLKSFGQLPLPTNRRQTPEERSREPANTRPHTRAGRHTRGYVPPDDQPQGPRVQGPSAEYDQEAQARVRDPGRRLDNHRLRHRRHGGRRRQHPLTRRQDDKRHHRRVRQSLHRHSLSVRRGCDNLGLSVRRGH